MKSESRVKGYKKGTKDWAADYNMLLDDGVTCNDCAHNKRCFAFGFSRPGSERCDFYPNRFLSKPAAKMAAYMLRRDLSPYTQYQKS